MFQLLPMRSILGGGCLALIDEGSISSAKVVGGDCIARMSPEGPFWAVDDLHLLMRDPTMCSEGWMCISPLRRSPRGVRSVSGGSILGSG